MSTTTVQTVRGPMTVLASERGAPVLHWYCAPDREGNILHVDAAGNIVHGPSRLVHTGGRLECPISKEA